MPGLVQRGRKRPSRALSDDDEIEQSDPSSSVSVGSKRARRARDASPSQDRANGNRSHNYASGTPIEEVFQPGTLVRVKLKNFVTYTAAEFHLGPSLNMIIGPNGTGKSTLVCAICLGLGWSPELLGRAKDIALFVKNGSDSAEIEIELAAGPGMASNPIVTRLIRKKDSKTRFWIDGKVVGKNTVLDLCKQFSIQIDNLCQFLPQDRVVEFAKMQDVDRLRETQRAAAPNYMVEWHDQLKDLRTEEKGLEIKQQTEKSHLEVLEKQQNADREDVERFQQREGLLLKARCLEKVRPVIALAQLKNEFGQAKKDLQNARREFDLLNADVEPVRQAQEDMVAYKNKVEDVVKLRKNRLDLLKSRVDQLFTKIEQAKQNVADLTLQIDGEAKARKPREQDIARTKSEIQRLERQRQDQPVNYDAGSFEARKADLSAQGRIVSNRLLELETAHNTIARSIQELGAESGSIQEQRRRLDTESGKQGAALRKLSPDTANAWEWIRQHRNELSLKGEVHGPSILVCSIRDPRYADAVESQLRKGDLLAITFTNGDDQKLLSDILLGKGEGSLGLHDVHLRTSKNPLSSYQPPVPPAQLQNFGFEGYIVDYIEGPDAVLAMLCDSTKLHRTAYAARPITDQQHAAASNSAIQKWVSGRDVVQITTRREYGASSTGVTQLSLAKYFVNQPANSEEIRQLDEASARIKRDNAEYKEEIAKLREEKSTCDAQAREIRQAREELQVEQDGIRRAVAEWKALPNKIQRKQHDLDLLVQENAKTSSRIREIKLKLQEASLTIATLTLDYAKTVTQLRIFHEALVEAEIRLIEANSELNALVAENSAMLEKLNRKQTEIRELDTRNKIRKNEYIKLAQRTQQDLDVLSQEEKDLVEEYRQYTSLTQLEEQVQDVAARISMMVEGNSGILKTYEKRKEDIDRTMAKLGEHTANLEITKAKITEIRGRWEPELDALVAKISDAFAHNFEQIGCAGEVQVYKDEEDFDKWSIQISVRFREGEQLSVLNEQRQSGGERAVSTVFYLMALQDLAQSPFRVVDEINQGMDPRNERVVHGRMVDIACQENTSQYFLVTPKLLTGLKFHPKMKVHVINSGEHIPDAQDVKGTWNMRDFAKVALRTRKGIEVA